jgi:hypothetical protein
MCITVDLKKGQWAERTDEASQGTKQLTSSHQNGSITSNSKTSGISFLAFEIPTSQTGPALWSDFCTVEVKMYLVNMFLI